MTRKPKIKPQKEPEPKEIFTGAFIKREDSLEVDIRLSLNVNHPRYIELLSFLRRLQTDETNLITYSSGL
jgi:hypothetical protein